MSEAELRALLRESFEELKRSKARLAALEARQHEPIAVVSMACRFPGGADTPEELFRRLMEGRSALGEPSERRSATAPPRGTGAAGGYLDDVAGFDPAFFGMSPEEARQADPQQRLLLEVAWEAIERAGIPRGALKGRRAGVFVGASGSEYGELARRGTPEQHGVLGVVPSALPGRVSYFLGITGPSVTLDAGCASSLVAVHFAVQALRRRECDLALAGGVNVILDASGALFLDRMGVLSRSGRCRPFDASADGFVRGEGCGLVLLQRLGDAQRDGAPVLALIRGSAANHVGASNGMATPNGPGQEAVVRQALEDAGLEPGKVSYVECHGTGTRNGDAIEVQALASVYAPAHRVERLLLVGSAKGALGHGESAAGIASLVKAVTCLQRREIPGCSVDAPSATIPWDELGVSLVSKNRAWEAVEAPLRAGVHAYSMTGANAHILVEEAPARPASTRPLPAAPSLPILLSAHTGPALVAQARRLLGHLETRPDLALGDIAFSLANARTHFDHRLALRASDPASLLDALRRFVDAGGSLSEADGRRVVVEPLPAVAFLFPGGPPVAAGRPFEDHPAFQEIFRTVARAFASPIIESALLDAIAHEPSPAGGRRPPGADLAGPLLFAVEVALARLLQRWGALPALVLGEGVGAIAAACVADACAITEACELVAAYSLAERAPTRSEGTARLRRVVRATSFRAPSLPLSCAVTGRSLDARDLASDAYWTDQLGRTGQPTLGPPDLDGVTALVALGPGAERWRPVSEQVGASWLSAVGEQPLARMAVLDALSGLHVHGVDVSWAAFFAPFAGCQVELPTYAWQRQQYWLDAPAPQDEEHMPRCLDVSEPEEDPGSPR